MRNKFTYKILYFQDCCNFIVYEYYNNKIIYRYSTLEDKEDKESKYSKNKKHERVMNWVNTNYPPNSIKVKNWVSKNYPPPNFFKNNNAITNIKEFDREEINIIKKIYLAMGIAICIIYIIFKLIFILKDAL